MKRLGTIIAAATLVLAGAAQAQAVKVEDLAARWTAAYNQQDANRMGAIYTETAELYIHGKERIVGREEIKDYWAADMRIGSPLTFLTVTDTVQGLDMILVHGNYQVVDRATGVPQGQGRFAHIWLKTLSGDWLLDRDLWNQPGE